MGPDLHRVTADSVNGTSYFPEKQLAVWLRERGDETPVYWIARQGPARLYRAYSELLKQFEYDCVVLVDGGTDSLLRGDEESLGTPVEDMASIAAVDMLDDAQVPRKLLASIGFGIDAFHGVCHAHVLETIAALSASGGYLGAIALTLDMPEVQLYREAVLHASARSSDHISIVNTSIVSALEGRFGDHQVTPRTSKSELFINPLMSMMWCFRLKHLARLVGYLDGATHIESFNDFARHIESFQNSTRNPRQRRHLPI